MSVKFLLMIVAIQFVLLGLVLVKLGSLDEKMALVIEPKTPQMATPVRSNQDLAPHQSLSEAQIRAVIRQELAVLNDRLLRSGEPATTPATVADIPQTVNLEQLQELEARVDYLMGDGDFSISDMNEFEASLATLPPELRQKLLNKMVKSMTASNTSLSR